MAAALALALALALVEVAEKALILQKREQGRQALLPAKPQWTRQPSRQTPPPTRQAAGKKRRQWQSKQKALGRDSRRNSRSRVGR